MHNFEYGIDNSQARQMAVELMEKDENISKLKGEDWYKTEDNITNMIVEFFGLKNENEKILSHCNKSSSDESPTTFEENIFRKVERHYHKLDILSVIDDDQEQRNWEGIARLKYQTQDLDNLVSKYEDRITGEENMFLARETLKDYQDSHLLEIDDGLPI